MRSLFFSAILLSLLLPSLVSAEAITDVYGDSVTAHSPANLLNPLNAAGAPDNQFADFKDDGTYLTIDMGEGEEGVGDLIVSMRLFEYGATGKVTFYDADMIVLWTTSVIFSPGTTTWTAPYLGEGTYRFVKVESPEEQDWGVDAIQATQVNTPSAPVPQEGEPESIPYNFGGEGDERAGKLIKSAESQAVYLVGADGQRHAFPNETVFSSWGYDFSEVETVSAQVLAAYALGKNVTVRPGTWLIKITTDPKTYAVEPGGVLRHIKSESVARNLYGEAWNERIVDIDQVFWKNYTVGSPVDSSAVFPDGSIIADVSGSLAIGLNGLRRTLNDEEAALLRVDETFALQGDANASPSIAEAATNEDLVRFFHPF